MPITLHCSCGKTLQVDDQHRGKKVKCSACGNLLTATSETQAEMDLGAAVSAEGPGKRPTASDNDAEVPEVRKPIKRPSEAGQSMAPWLIVGVVGLVALLGCVLCGGGGIWYFSRSR